jgi:hypothetical protein
VSPHQKYGTQGLQLAGRLHRLKPLKLHLLHETYAKPLFQTTLLRVIQRGGNHSMGDSNVADSLSGVTSRSTLSLRTPPSLLACMPVCLFVLGLRVIPDSICSATFFWLSVRSVRRERALTFRAFSRFVPLLVEALCPLAAISQQHLSVSRSIIHLGRYIGLDAIATLKALSLVNFDTILSIHDFST